MRDFIHVVDLIDAHVLLQDHLGNPPPLYNVGTGKGVSVREIVEACGEMVCVAFNTWDRSKAGAASEPHREWGGALAKS